MHSSTATCSAEEDDDRASAIADHQGRRILVTDLSGSHEWLVRQRA